MKMGASNSKNQEKYLCMQLHNAVSSGSEAAVRELLLCGAVNPNNKLFIHSRKLMLPLFSAIENNFFPLVELLLEYGASTSALNSEGQMALHLAVSENLIEIVETLLRHQADPSSLNAHGETPLHIAATYGLVNMASLLVRSGASVNVLGKYQRTPFHSACAIPGNNDMIMALLDSGVDPDALDEDRRAPLHYLAQLGNTQGIDILLQAGANKNICDANGKTALHFTVENEEVPATRALLRHQCDINVQDNNGQTPLYKAVDKEYGDLVSILLHNGADANLPTTSGLFPLRMSVWKKNTDIAQKLILDGGAQVNACDRTGITPLHVACLYALKDCEEDKELVCFLLHCGADVNAQCTKQGKTPLHNAVEAKNDETVRSLLRKGADTTIVDNKGKTAAAISSVPSITALLENAISSQGNIALGSSSERTPVLSRHLDVNLSQPSGQPRTTNLYTPPTARSNRDPLMGNMSNGGISPPPPLPPRDALPLSLNHVNGGVPGPSLIVPPLVQTNVIRHNFVWSSSNETQQESSSSSSRVKVDVTSSSKLLNFPVSFGGGKSDPSTVCYSIFRAGQLINTKLGCLVNVEPASVNCNLLLYVEAMNYSLDVLQLPKSYRLCSNIIHFYTHDLSEDVQGCSISAQQDLQPGKETPHFLKNVIVEFPLKKSALSMLEDNENEVKVLVSYDEGSSWNETSNYIEKVCFENSCIRDDTATLVVTESDELGMYAIVLGPKQDTKTVTLQDEKVISSVDASVSVSVSVGHSETCFVEITAAAVQPHITKKLQSSEFPYLRSCSRMLSVHLTNKDGESSQNYSVSIQLPCPMQQNSNHGDITYRILKKSEETLRGGWCAVQQAEWQDVTRTECQQLQISNKGKRLLSSSASNSSHVFFTVNLRADMRHAFIVAAVRSFSQSITSHLIKLPDAIEKLQTSASLSFLIHQKVIRLNEVTCDIVSSKDADTIDKIYRDSDSYVGQQPSNPQVIQERDCILISTVGGVKLRNAETSRKVIFNSALLPFSEKFTIKGTSCSYNTTIEHIGYFEFTLNNSNNEKEEGSCSDQASVAKPRQLLNSESSVLVMENCAFSDQPASPCSSMQELGKNLLASLLVHLPRKNRTKLPTANSSNASTLDRPQLTTDIMHLICRVLDRLELKDLSFQLGITDDRLEEAFSHSRNCSETAGVSLLQQWSEEKAALHEDVIPSLCEALSCIGRENLSQDVARRCNPFVLEELTGLSPLPEVVLQRNDEDLLNSDVSARPRNDRAFPHLRGIEA